MNVQSAKLWMRAFVDLLSDVVIAAPWFPYAEGIVDRERGLRDSLVFAERCDGAVAVGGEFSRGTAAEWELFGKLGRPRIDLTRPPMPSIFTTETFYDVTRDPKFKLAVTSAFQGAIARKAA
jgi:hypothetical protein